MSQSERGVIVSIHDQLRNRAKATGRNVEDLLYYYAVERFLYRLAQSRFRDQFVLKGAFVIYAWGVPLERPTRDIDLRGFTDNGIDHLVDIMKEVCLQEVELDGMFFDPASLQGENIIEDADDRGVRIRFLASLGKSRIRMRLDIGFSDVITPSVIPVKLPTLINLPAPDLRGYPPETFAAEKLQSMIHLGEINSRMKDFYDLWLLSRHLDFDGSTLQAAIRKTFQNRNTEIPESLPVAFTDEFASMKESMWETFTQRFVVKENELEAFQRVINDLKAFLVPPMRAFSSSELFNAVWKAGGPWREA